MRFHTVRRTLHTRQRSGGCAFCRTCRIEIRFLLVRHTCRLLQPQRCYNRLPLSTDQPMHQCEMACELSALVLAFLYEVRLLQVVLSLGKATVLVRGSTSDTKQGEPLLHHCLRMHLP